MKKISYILAALVLCFSLNAHAGSLVTKDMLEQVWNVTSGYRPVVGNTVYTVQKNKTTIVVVRFYDGNGSDLDPEKTDMQAVFLKTKSGVKLVALTFSPVDVTKYIDLLVE